jgi:hypothetical protein
MRRPKRSRLPKNLSVSGLARMPPHQITVAASIALAEFNTTRSGSRLRFPIRDCFYETSPS